MLLLVCVVSAAMAKCPSVATQAGFNASAYLGTWYEIARSPLVSGTFERRCLCTHAVYGLNATTGDVTVNNFCNLDSVSGKVQHIAGYATLDKADNAKLTVFFPGRGPPFGAPYWVVDVVGNYEIAVVWSCESVVVALEFMWILARSPNISAAQYQAVAAAAESITTYPALKKLQLTRQTGCTY